MRVGKLAKELGCGEADVLGLIHRLGYPRYTSAEQQLPAEVIERVRRHAPELARRPPPPPTVRPGPVRSLDTPADDATRRLLEKELAGVRPMAPSRPAAKPGRDAPRPVRLAAPAPAPSTGGARPVPPAPPSAAPPPLSAAPPPPSAAPPPPSAAPPPPSAAPPAPPPAADPRVAELERLVGRLELERRALLERATLAERERDEALGRLRAATPARSLRELLALRGLVGDDEVDFFFSALGNAHRGGDLVDRIGSSDPGVERWLAERVVLIGPDEREPPGLVGVPVPAARSEGAGAPPVRNALNRLATTLLVHGKRRLAVIGGPPVAVRVLREGLDRRIELTVAVGTVPGALVVVWGSAELPGALRVEGRDVIAFCNEVVAALEG